MTHSIKDHTKENASEALCGLASKESWCWKISCTTCGHMFFAFGFKELILGGHPGSDEWLSRRNKRFLELRDEIRPLSRALGARGTVRQQKALIEIFKNASLKKISRQCKFPDWLGYLGLALFYTAKVERVDRVLTREWVPQLIEMVPSSDAFRCLNFILENDLALGVDHLELMEEAIEQSRDISLSVPVS